MILLRILQIIMVILFLATNALWFLLANNFIEIENFPLTDLEPLTVIIEAFLVGGLQWLIQRKMKDELISVSGMSQKVQGQQNTIIFGDDNLIVSETVELSEVEIGRRRQIYLDNLHEEVNQTFVLGKPETMPLEGIYTDVNVLEKPTAFARYNIDELRERGNYHQQWYQRQERVDGLAIVKQYNKLFILGKPGAGKTTFLKFIALQAINGEIPKLPVFISLKELADSEGNIFPFIVEQFRQLEFLDAQAYLLETMKKGEVIVLLDGLDEVNEKGGRRDKIVKMIKAFNREFRKSQILLTCRVAASDYSFAGYEYIEVADFSEVQMQTFIGQWFEHETGQGKQCWQELKIDRSLKELAQVPLLLTLLCIVFEELNHFPINRHEIYKEATQALLNRWDAKRKIRRDEIYKGLTLEVKQNLLAEVAAKTFSEGDYFLDGESLARLISDFLKKVPNMINPEGGIVLQAIEAQHGLLVERARGFHSFSHLTLQEYFASKYIVDNAYRGTLERLMTHIGDERWREIFLLTAGMMSDATGLFELYTKALQEMFKDQDKLLAYLNWGYSKSVKVLPIDRMASIHAFYLGLDRALASSRALALDLDHVHAFTVSRARALARTIDLDLDLDIDIAQDRVRMFSLALARVRARTRSRSLDYDQARKFALTLNVDLDHARAFVVALDLDLDLDHALDLPDDYAIDYLLCLALIVLSYRGHYWFEIVPELAKVISVLQSRCEKSGSFRLGKLLKTIQLPAPGDANNENMMAIEKQLTEIAWGERSIGKDWEFNHHQEGLLFSYFEANKLLLECLRRATVQNRNGIKESLLLPLGKIVYDKDKQF